MEFSFSLIHIPSLLSRHASISQVYFFQIFYTHMNEDSPWAGERAQFFTHMHRHNSLNWGDSSAVKKRCCFCRGPKFSSKYSHNNSQLAVTQFQGIWHPLLVSRGISYTWCTGKTLTHIKKYFVSF